MLPAKAGDLLGSVIAKGELVIGVDAAYPPQSFLDDEGKFAGFDVDVGKAISRELGVRAVVREVNWEVIFTGQWRGQWDLLAGSLTPTRERATKLDFSDPYYFSPAMLAVHQANKTINHVGDASGKRIGVAGQTTYESYLNQALVIDAAGAVPFEYRIADADIRPYAGEQLVLDDLKLGDGVRLDAAVSALPFLKLAQQYGYPIKVIEDPLFYEPLALAFEKGSPNLVAKTNEILARLRSSGELADLSRKWHGADLTNPSKGAR
ncbi:amino acid ABC transporter substrate-binding protein [Zhengella mangrovi]|uniref:Amino acid ABC transporter substrate-binding protein n=2 Tax=Zhengella mangrovi TaxID=1982044 RepID=A0A2G1QQJ4_9HYPH|nr:amino acid ABC transporter substrate-binding protein [Zhengella mangrovi]